MKVYYEGDLLYELDFNGKVKKPKKRKGSVSSVRCPDCDLRDALTHHGLPLYCSECRQARRKGKSRCLILSCANGCEACGGTGRVPA